MPSLEEIEAELKGLKAEIEEAIQQKNFKKADSLTKNIDKVKVNLEEERGNIPSNCGVETSEKPLSQFINERGEKITFESRYKLEEEIIRFKTLVKNAVNAKKFKEAEETQRSLDQIEEL